MATSPPSSQAEVQCPQVSSSGLGLEVEVDDEIPGPSAPRLEHSPALHFCSLKRKREWSDSEEDLEEDAPGIFDLIPWGSPVPTLQNCKQERDWEWSLDSKEELGGWSDSDLGAATSPLAESSVESTVWEWSSESQKDQQEEEQTGLAGSVRGVEHSSPPQSPIEKKNVEWSSHPQRDQEEEQPGWAETVPSGEPLSPPQFPLEKREGKCSSHAQEEQGLEQEKELPGLADSKVDPSSSPLSWTEKKNRDWSSDPQGELEKKLPGLAGCSSPGSWGQNPDCEWSTGCQEELLGLDDSILGVDLSPQTQAPAHKSRGSSSDSQQGHPGLAASAPEAETRLSPQSGAQKRKRESSSESEEELEQKATNLGPEPQQPSRTKDTECGRQRTPKRKRVSSVLPEHHEVFTRLLEDPVIKSFLAWDKELRVSDKYLLSMVIAYFSRAGLFSWQYRRMHFFLALYIASDMEEDSQAPKQAMLSFLYGKSFTQRPLFHRLRLQLVKSMYWNLRVSREECEEIQAYNPGLWVWSRDRTLLPTSPGTQDACRHLPVEDCWTPE